MTAVGKSFASLRKTWGVKYIARTTHEHAKAGNINNALKYAKGEFVSIFDCDHVPTRSFLQMTMGWFPERETAGDDADAAPLLLAGPV